MDKATHARRGRIWMRRIALFLLLAILAGWAAFRFSPRPSALLVRWAFDRASEQTNARLAAHVPAGVAERLDLRYAEGDPDALLDLYLPEATVGTPQRLTTILWIHGGGFVSGRKEHIRNYSKILASRGFVVATVGYGIAPGSTWPTPSRQVNAALGWLQREAATYNIDPGRFVLAGDSAGAQISAELANAITSPAHAARLGIVPAIQPGQLAGILLYCGPYDVALVDWDSPFAAFMRTVLWSYSGRRDFLDDPRLDSFSVTRHLTPAFPPSFVSVGNADPLKPHSLALAEALRAHGVRAETLFFPDDYTPPLPHIYQFDLGTEAGRLALERSMAFLHSLDEAGPVEAAAQP